MVRRLKNRQVCAPRQVHIFANACTLLHAVSPQGLTSQLRPYLVFAAWPIINVQVHVIATHDLGLCSTLEVSDRGSRTRTPWFSRLKPYAAAAQPCACVRDNRRRAPHAWPAPRFLLVPRRLGALGPCSLQSAVRQRSAHEVEVGEDRLPGRQLVQCAARRARSAGSREIDWRSRETDLTERLQRAREIDRRSKEIERRRVLQASPRRAKERMRRRCTAKARSHRAPLGI